MKLYRKKMIFPLADVLVSLCGYKSNWIETFVLTADYVRFDIKKLCTSGQSNLDIAYKIYDQNKTTFELHYTDKIRVDVQLSLLWDPARLSNSPTHHDRSPLEAFTPGQASSLPIYGSVARGTEFYK
jgi:hypothetical protein